MVMHKVALGTFTTQPSIFILQLLVYCPSTNMLVLDLVSSVDMQACLHWLLRQLFVTECSFLWMCVGPVFQDISPY
jgi:hypothetical protein